MTIHKSLKGASTLRRARNVLSRAERLKILADDGRWTEEKSVFGLPKVRQFTMKRRHKAAKKEEGAEGAAAPGAAAPAAAAAAPAKGAAAAKAAAPAKGKK